MTELRSDVAHARSVIEEAWLEAHKHKWIESQKRGYDLGEAAIRDWFQRYWNVFWKRKFVQHLHGQVFWEEFSSDKFGLLETFPLHQDHSYQFVLDLFYDGTENLFILNTALTTGLPMDAVRRMLQLIDMNNCRVDPPYRW